MIEIGAQRPQSCPIAWPNNHDTGRKFGNLILVLNWGLKHFQLDCSSKIKVSQPGLARNFHCSGWHSKIFKEKISHFHKISNLEIKQDDRSLVARV